MFGVMEHLNIELCRNADEAKLKGYDYHLPEVKAVRVVVAVVVREGTVGHNPTVDFLMEDEDGQKYVFMITGRLLKSIPC